MFVPSPCRQLKPPSFVWHFFRYSKPLSSTCSSIGMRKLFADTSACTAHTVVEPSWSFLLPGVYHQPPEFDWLLPITLTAAATTSRIFLMSASGLTLHRSARPYASDSASVANPWPWIHEWPWGFHWPPFCWLSRNCSPLSRALPRSPSKGSSLAER